MEILVHFVDDDCFCASWSKSDYFRKPIIYVGPPVAKYFFKLLVKTVTKVKM